MKTERCRRAGALDRCPVASATECTGRMPALPADGAKDLSAAAHDDAPPEAEE